MAAMRVPYTPISVEGFRFVATFSRGWMPSMKVLVATDLNPIIYLVSYWAILSLFVEVFVYYYLLNDVFLYLSTDQCVSICFYWPMCVYLFLLTNMCLSLSTDQCLTYLLILLSTNVGSCTVHSQLCLLLPTTYYYSFYIVS